MHDLSKTCSLVCKVERVSSRRVAYHAVNAEEKGCHSEPLCHAQRGGGKVLNSVLQGTERLLSSIPVDHLRRGGGGGCVCV